MGARIVAFESLGNLWFSATEEELDTIFPNIEDVDADRFDALPKADRSRLGGLVHGSYCAALLFHLGTKMKKPYMEGSSGQVLLYQVPAKAQTALAKRGADPVALAAEWTTGARASNPMFPVVSAETAQELATLAAHALERDAWVCAIVVLT